ncbi:MAG: 4-(cytidine 5'-diphospho)-2-C-methyl-D-erythritol kinase [Corynebacterium sp.]|nr:4-(cytidine 5'-diphospho)-2-C-methyl-D-erythritol kinase [Corynebacterium sp.]
MSVQDNADAGIPARLADKKVLGARAHAKVNLHLGVGPLRADGYHELVTVFQSLDLHDSLEFSLVPWAGQRVAKLTCDNSAVPIDATNLAWRAAELVLDGEPADFSVVIDIHKGIPTAGGMAGGSADAAATLVALNQLRSQPFLEQQLVAQAATLGSDVPFTLLGHTQLAHGRGEILTRVLSRGQYHWVLAFATRGLSTPEVFGHLDNMQREPNLDADALCAALASGDVHAVARLLHNDMQPAAFSLRPELRRTWHIGMDSGALAGIVSGSGPTMAFLCEDAEMAATVASELQLEGKVAIATGPAPGAQLLDG